MANEKVKVPKMVKFAMAQAKLDNPRTSGAVRTAWLNALRGYTEGKKRQGKHDRDARGGKPVPTETETASTPEA